jgi:anti-anti-sigma factor
MDKTFDHITAQPSGEILIVEVNVPALDNFGVAHMTAIDIESSIASSQVKKVIVSLKNVKFVTSAGLTLFARLISLAKDSGIRLVLCDAVQGVSMTLKVTRMIKADRAAQDQRLLLASDRDSALAELA